MRRRALAALALGLLASACSAVIAETPPAALPRSAFVRMACSLPPEQLQRVINGYYPGRSGDIVYVPREPNSMATWYSHTGPYDYLQEVPLLFYGPGQIPAVGTVATPVTLADVAPTIGALAGFEHEALDGRPIADVLGAPATEPPALIVTMVWDSAGWNVLREHPDAWPYLAGIGERGVVLDRATLGTSPSISGSIHATLGTGAFPDAHGRVDHFVKLEDELVFIEETGTTDLLLPTAAELFDESVGNRAVVGAVAFNQWHLGMIGHGSARDGGDPDIAVLRNERTWALPSPSRELFRFPDGIGRIQKPPLPAIDALDGDADARFFDYPLPIEPAGLDREDGVIDDAWFDRTLEEIELLADDLRWSEWETRVIDRLIRDEGFGAGGPTDLLFVNYKQIDKVGHEWTMNSPEMEVVVRATDVATRRLVEILDRRVGRGRWVLVVTADHGSTPSTAVSGGFQISERELKHDIERVFHEDAPELIRPSQMWADEEVLAAEGDTLEQLATYLAGYTKGDSLVAGERLPAPEHDDLVFAAAFPSEILEGLRCPADG